MNFPFIREAVSRWFGKQVNPSLAAKTKQREGRVFHSGPYTLCGNSHKVGKVDTKTLVVGQDIYMFSGCYVNKGKVVKTTPSGVDVEITVSTPTLESLASWQAGKITSGEMKTTDQ
jgi:hypothetical protein